MAKWAYAAVWAALVFFFAWHPLTSGSDLYAHAAVGRWMAEHHAIPTHTLFLWSTEQPWIAHSWLSEMLAFRAMSAGPTLGPALCVGVSVLLFCGVFLILWLARDPDAPVPWALPVLFACGILASAVRLNPRPEAFSFLFVAVTLVFLVRRRPGGSPDTQGAWKPISPVWIALTPLMFALWANLHGGVMNGLLLMGSAFACEAVQYRFDRGARQLGLLLVLCAAAILLNPYGLRYFTIYTQVNSAVFRHIAEWFPLYKPPYPLPVLLLSGGLLATSSLAVLLARRPWNLTQIAWWLYGLVTCIEARRNIMILVPVCLVILVTHQAEILALERRLRAAFSPNTQASSPLPPLVFQALVFVAIAANADFFALPDPLDLQPPYTIPAGQADFLLANQISGKVFNDYDNAAYFEWHLYGHNRFFIDNMNAYGDALETAYQRLLFHPDQGRALLDQNGVACVIGRRKGPYEREYPPLYDWLSQNPEWNLAYRGMDGPIWVRRGPAVPSNFGAGPFIGPAR
ncbi:MAG TPA: hypothetical protein VKT32_05910 [Chthonomonadaceae bacterium]|nr:hypothetical protein [Chthonomonadaceae bacterium]